MKGGNLWRSVVGEVLLLCLWAVPLTAEEPVHFVEVSDLWGIDFVHRTGARGAWHDIETMGSGCAVFDFDGDGDLDLYFVNGANLPGQPEQGHNALYRNDLATKGRFTDVTQSARVPGRGYGMGCTVGDCDNDGDLDLYVTGYPANVLYQNDGHGRFADVTDKAGVSGGGWSAGAAFFDAENDGDLDLYVARYLDYNPQKEPPCERAGERTYCDPGYFKGAPDLLFRNEGNGRFTDISAEAGIADSSGKGLGVITLDYDGDGDTDLYVANDTTPNFLYRNDGGHFEEVGLEAGVAFNADGRAQAGMGIDAGDYDNDGRPDLAVTNFSYETNDVYHNENGKYFLESSLQTGIAAKSLIPLGFGVNFLDVDFDGDPDLFVVNGHIFPNVKHFSEVENYAQPDQLFLNTGGHFEDISVKAGIEAPAVGRGSAVGDFDGDGDLDIVVSNSGGRAQVWRNDTAEKHWVILTLIGGMRPDKKTSMERLSNRMGIGARVRIMAGGMWQAGEVRCQSSYLSTSDVRLYFGLGAAARVDSINVYWPSGRRQMLGAVAANHTLIVKEVP